MLYSLVIYKHTVFIKMDRIGQDIQILILGTVFHSQTIFPLLCFNTRLSLSGNKRHCRRLQCRHAQEGPRNFKQNNFCLYASFYVLSLQPSPSLPQKGECNTKYRETLTICEKFPRETAIRLNREYCKREEAS